MRHSLEPKSQDFSRHVKALKKLEDGNEELTAGERELVLEATEQYTTKSNVVWAIGTVRAKLTLTPDERTKVDNATKVAIQTIKTFNQEEYEAIGGEEVGDELTYQRYVASHHASES